MAVPHDITVNTNHAVVTYLIGFSIRETATAAARFVLRRGSVTGQIIVDIPLAAGEGATALGISPVHCPDGVYVEQAVGAVSGVLHSK